MKKNKNKKENYLLIRNKLWGVGSLSEWEKGSQRISLLVVEWMLLCNGTLPADSAITTNSILDNLIGWYRLDDKI